MKIIISFMNFWSYHIISYHIHICPIYSKIANIFLRTNQPSSPPRMRNADTTQHQCHCHHRSPHKPSPPLATLRWTPLRINNVLAMISVLWVAILILAQTCPRADLFGAQVQSGLTSREGLSRHLAFPRWFCQGQATSYKPVPGCPTCWNIAIWLDSFRWYSKPGTLLMSRWNFF